MSQVTYQIDPAHSSAHFSIRHMMISNVRGEFTKLSGTIIYDSENPANSSIDAEIDAAWKAEVERRVAEAEAGNSATYTWEEVQAPLRARLAK